MSAKKKLCDVEGCSSVTKKTVSREKSGAALKKAGLTLSIRDKVTKVHLCADHYRKIKKQLKKDREIERLRWG
ncbi:MAG: hypothetical protein JSW11_06335 [Candidatus Heimdallarchaeota archaeon]|nr:MAG: hypothetical protein JSW11_06335 [Candidatus Heimdallarchaeota archaeon]